MSTLALVTTNGIALAVGAAVMYLPAVRKLTDARLVEARADRTFTAAESLADTVEANRNLPWHYAEPVAELPAEAHHEGEVLHVDHPTAEHETIADKHTDACPDLYYCPTVDEVESGCHGGFDVCCSAPELHVPIPDERDDEDEVGDEQPGEAWFAGLARRWQQFVAWLRSFGQARRERNLIGSGEQATADDPFAELLAHVGAVPYTGRHWAAGTEHTGLHQIITPAQRDGGEA